MLSTLLIAAMAVTAVQDTDTVFSASGVARLMVEQHKGSVAVRMWDRDEIRIQADHSQRTRLDIRRRGATVSVELDGRRPDIAVHYTIDVPKNIDLDLEGLVLDVEVDGVYGDIVIETLQGTVDVRNSGGELDAETLSGSIDIDGFDGDVMASSTSQHVTLRRVRGAIQIEAVSGVVALHDITASALEIESISGGIEFSGSLDPGGHHVFMSHSGEVVLDLEPGAHLSLEISNHSGSVDMDYPDATLVETHHGTSLFELGGGGSRVEIETFSGSVRIRERRPR